MSAFVVVVYLLILVDHDPDNNGGDADEDPRHEEQEGLHAAHAARGSVLLLVGSGWMDEWVLGWMTEWTNKRMYGKLEKRRMYEWINDLMYK